MSTRRMHTTHPEVWLLWGGVPLRVGCVVALEGSPDPLVDRGCSQGYWVCYGVTTHVAGATFHMFV